VLGNKTGEQLCTYISAFGYKHKILQMPDPTASFLVKKSLQGYNNDKKQIDQWPNG
jgi:hypothetical protein